MLDPYLWQFAELKRQLFYVYRLLWALLWFTAPWLFKRRRVSDDPTSCSKHRFCSVEIFVQLINAISGEASSTFMGIWSISCGKSEIDNPMTAKRVARASVFNRSSSSPT